MLASITPLGERGRGRRWGITAGFFTVGSMIGGAARGFVLGGLASLIPHAIRPTPTSTTLIVAAALGLAAVAELRKWPVAGLGPQRQVNEDWLDTYRGWVVGAGFGFQLGTGVMVYITTAASYVVFLLEALTFSPRAGALLGAVFGIGRALPVLATGRITTPVALRRAHAWMRGASRPAERLVASACAVAAIAVMTGGLS